MRRSIIIIIIIALLAGCGPRPTTALKVMTMNLRHDVDFWEERFPMIAAEIIAAKPDLIGFQEVEIGQMQSVVLHDMISAGGGTDYQYHEELKTGLAVFSGEGIAAFSRSPIASRATVDLMYGRPATFDRVQIGDLTIDFFNVHLHNEGGDEVRAPQMQALMDFVRANDAGNTMFLTGDMNSLDDSEAIRIAIDFGFVDTFKAVHGEDTARIGNTVPVKLDKSLAPQAQTHRIDYVFMRAAPSTVVHATSSTVAFNHRNAEGLYPSDHLGVMTTFEVELP